MLGESKGYRYLLQSEAELFLDILILVLLFSLREKIPHSLELTKENYINDMSSSEL